MGSHVEAVDVVALDRHLHRLSRLGVKLVEIHVVATLRTEIHHAVSPRPVGTAVGRRVEVLRQGRHLLRGKVVEEQLVLRHARRHVGRQLTANAVEGLGGAANQQLRGIGRELGVSQEALALQHRVHLQRTGIHEVDVLHLRGALGQTRVAGDDEQLRAVL